ncbi:hypothetical protein OE88DRAFT_1530791 [Heliocybe sulcata]|uniref:Uncharacterized protein n=1 Tax=Heliocybe sulcata TaxID=5364 RepID=A0A5C3N273_9AGAM|nr:hypothetical protein OE88DRAFT_1530791 [Heliocybe sulcata]
MSRPCHRRLQRPNWVVGREPDDKYFKIGEDREVGRPCEDDGDVSLKLVKLDGGPSGAPRAGTRRQGCARAWDNGDLKVHLEKYEESAGKIAPKSGNAESREHWEHSASSRLPAASVFSKEASAGECSNLSSPARLPGGEATGDRQTMAVNE